MTKMLIAMALGILLMAGLASAQTLPVPVSGRVTTDGYNGGYEVKVTNVRTGDTMSVFTNTNGEYMISSWTNTYPMPRLEDVFKLEVEDQYKNIVYKGGAIEADFELEATCPKCPPTPECQTCPEQVECNSCCHPKICPECQACKPTELSDCVGFKDEICGSEPSCPVDPLAYLLGAGVMGVIAVFAYIGKIKIGRKGEDAFSQELNKNLSERSGFRAFKSNGTVLVKHIHNGITGYHSPDIVHSNVKYRHERGKLFV